MLRTWSWTDPPWDTVRISILSCHQLISYNVYAYSLDLRSSRELGMCKGFTLGLSNATPWKGSYKGSFGFVTKHAASHGWSRWDLPSVQRRDICWPLEWLDPENVWPYSRLSVNRASGIPCHGNRERWLSYCKDDKFSPWAKSISWGKGKKYILLWKVRPIWSLRVFGSRHVLLEAATDYWSSSVLAPCPSIREPIGSHT